MSGPFKFLDAYAFNDRKSFFGRNAEIDALYKLVSQARLVLVYGASGTGKTSIIQCGLANRFKPTDWLAVPVRRKDDINASMALEIRRSAATAILPDADIAAAIRSLYLDNLRPIYLIFDQFEELFILGKPAEQEAFFASVDALLASDLRCKILISMREEYIAQLQDFEKRVPTLFNNRLRIEQMSPVNLEQVVLGMTAAAGITLEHGPATAAQIIDQIREAQGGVQLAYLQVYLDKLCREAAATGTPLLFTQELIQRVGKLGDVMAHFLDEQTAAIEIALAPQLAGLPPNCVQRVLEALTTPEGTKQPVTRSELAARMLQLAPVLDAILMALEQRRIVRFVDGTLELLHDSLAGRIAERRSTDRKVLMRAEKLIRDRLAGYQSAKTWLAPEELAVVRPVLAQLDLAPTERKFVDRSSRRASQRRMAWIGGTAAVIALLAGFGAWAFVERRAAKDAIALASDSANTLSFTILGTLEALPGTELIRRDLLAEVAKVNEQLEGKGSFGSRNAGFWQAILEGDIAMAGMDAANYIKARRQFADALAAAKRLETQEPGNLMAGRNVVVALSRLANAEHALDNDQQASALYNQALAADRLRARRNPGDLPMQNDLMLSYLQLGSLEGQRGRLAEARQHLAQARVLARKLVAAQPGVLQALADLAVALQSSGDTEKLAGQFAAAKTYFIEARSHHAQMTLLAPQQMEWRRNQALVEAGLAEIGLELKDLDGARAASQAAIVAAQALQPNDSAPMLAAFYRTLAEIELAAGRPVPARAAALEAQGIAAAMVSNIPDDPAARRSLALAHRQSSDVERAQCRLDAARILAGRALVIAARLAADFPDETDYTVDLYNVHSRAAEIAHLSGDLPAARRAMAEALRLARAASRQLPGDRQIGLDLADLHRRIADLERGVPARCETLDAANS